MYIVLSWIGIMIICLFVVGAVKLWPWVKALKQEADEEYKKTLDSMGKKPSVSGDSDSSN